MFGRSVPSAAGVISVSVEPVVVAASSLINEEAPFEGDGGLFGVLLLSGVVGAGSAGFSEPDPEESDVSSSGSGSGSGVGACVGSCSQLKYSETVILERFVSLFFRKAICGEVILACTNSTLIALLVSLFVGVPRFNTVFSPISISSYTVPPLVFRKSGLVTVSGSSAIPRSWCNVDICELISDRSATACVILSLLLISSAFSFK